MSKTVKMTFVVPESLQNELRLRIIQDGYGLRGKSRWVREAIGQLLSLDNYPEYVALGDELKGFEKAETIVVTTELRDQLNQAIMTIRKDFPLLEGVQSRIIRSSILQRLIRKL